MTFIVEVTATKAVYTGKAGEGFLSLNRREAFQYATESEAKLKAEGFNKFHGQPVYQAVEYVKTVTNLMSGKEIVIAEDTPISCDPSSETYWSM